MELYEITLHFPDSYKSLENEDLTLKSTEYYESAEKAIERAKVIASSFVVPVPDYFYVGDGLTIWTDYPDKVKEAIHYELLASKPTIKPITNEM